MKAIVTGALGFVGSHLVSNLHALGVETLAVDLPRYDVADINSMATVIRRFSPNIVFHLAGQANVKASKLDPYSTWKTNVIGTATVLESVRREAPSSRVVVASSASVYGARHDWRFREDEAPSPLSPYARSKAAIELVAQSYAYDFSMSVSIVRPFNLIGPGQSYDYLLPSLIRKLLIQAEGNDEAQLTISKSDSIRDFVDVRDGVEALAIIGTRGAVGETYNICSGRGVSVRNVAKKAAKIIGLDVNIVNENRDAGAVECDCLVGSPEKIESMTGWRPAVVLDVTIRDIVSHVQHDGSFNAEGGR